MENINLVSGTGGRSGDKKEIIGASLKWLLALVAIVVLSYIAMVIYRGYLGRNIDKVTAEYQEKRKTFVSQNAKEVLDFQNRLDFARNSAKSQRDSVMDFREIEKLIIAGTYVTSYDYDNESGTVKIGCMSDNYDIMAKQILSLRGSSYFAIVSAGESTLDTKTNKVGFPITLKIN